LKRCLSLVAFFLTLIFVFFILSLIAVFFSIIASIFSILFRISNLFLTAIVSVIRSLLSSVFKVVFKLWVDRILHLVLFLSSRKCCLGDTDLVAVSDYVIFIVFVFICRFESIY